jgi:hypothetical protein
MAILMGMKDIQKQVNMSEATVLAWIRNEGFPARKVGGVWVSETETINRWFAKIVGDSQSPQTEKQNKDKKRKRQ